MLNLKNMPFYRINPLDFHPFVKDRVGVNILHLLRVYHFAV